MKVIFLDFNGVLDTSINMDEIDYSNLNRLKHIVNQTSAKVVISSSLKNSYYYTGKLSKKLSNIIKTLIEAGIDVIGITPKADNRETEIQLYLNCHPEIESFCIIDDDYYMESFSKNLIKLPNQMEEGQMGLDEIHMNMAIEILNNSRQKQYKL